MSILYLFQGVFFPVSDSSANPILVDPYQWKTWKKNTYHGVYKVVQQTIQVVYMSHLASTIVTRPALGNKNHSNFTNLIKASTHKTCTGSSFLLYQMHTSSTFEHIICNHATRRKKYIQYKDLNLPKCKSYKAPLSQKA